MNKEEASYIVVLPGAAHPIIAEDVSLKVAYVEAQNAVAHGAPEAHVYRRVGVNKRTEVKMAWVPVVNVPVDFNEWAQSPEAMEIR
jgi:hypothetical protein